MNLLKGLCVATLFIASGQRSIAQEKEIDLDPVSVTSSLSEANTSKTGRNIIIIKGDAFSKLPVHSIDELLRYVPGVEIQARGPMGTQSDIVLRGGTFQQVLVVLDGIRLNDPNTGHFTSYIPIAPSEIERIEILKGASSAIYGSDAVGGVINIITKTFSARQGEGKHQVSGQLTAGAYGLINANAGGFYSKGKTAISAGILSDNATGQPQRGTTGFLHLNTVSLSINHYLNEHWQIGFRSTIDNRKFAAQNFYTNLLLDTADEKVQTTWQQLKVGYQKQNNKVSFNLGYKAVEDKFRLNPSFAANDNKSKLFQALMVYEHKFSEATTVVSGGQFQNRNILSNDRGNHNVNQAAAFAILQQSIGTHFNMSPALRADWDELGGTELVPQINLSYKINHIQLRGSAGKTIRNADFTEQYNNYNKAFVGSGNRIGNPYLSAEHSFSYEMGADVFAAKSLKASVTYFQQDFRNLIDFVATAYNDMPRKINLSPTGTYFLADNIAQLTTRGIEADIQFSKQLQNQQQLFSTLGFVWLDSKNNQSVPSLYISSHARFLTNFNIQYTTQRYSINVSGLYKNRNPQITAQNASTAQAKLSTDYFITNIKAEVFIIKNKISVFAEADNVLNVHYNDLLGAQMPGRWLMGGMKVSLSK